MARLVYGALATLLVAATLCGCRNPSGLAACGQDPSGRYRLHGATWESFDGCVVYRCDDGDQVIFDDDFLTVEGDLVLGTQEAVDAQECLQVVEGDLTITNTAADLATIFNLERVGGTLTIDDSAMTGLSISRLTEVGGDTVITNNSELERIALKPELTVFGAVTVQNNDALPLLGGASPLDGSIDMSFRDAAFGTRREREEPQETTASEPLLGILYGPILVADNDRLEEIAVTDVRRAFESVRFKNNVALRSVRLGIVEVQGDLEFSDNPALDWESVVTLLGWIEVWGMALNCGNLGGVPCN